MHSLLSRLPGLRGAAAAMLAAAALSATTVVGTASAAEPVPSGDGPPAVVTPKAGSEQPFGYSGPVTVDFSGAAYGTWVVGVRCTPGGSIGFDWATEVTYDGTNPVQQLDLGTRMSAHDECFAYATNGGADGTLVEDENVFSVDEPPVHLSHVSQAPTPFYPLVRDGSRDATRTRFDLSRPADVRVRVRNSAGKVVRSAGLGSVRAGHASWSWAGRTDAGSRVPTGRYHVEVVAVDDAGNRDVATRRVDVATKIVTRSNSRRVSGAAGRRATAGTCYASRYDGEMELDCWGGRFARATYRFRIPRSAFHLTWRASGYAPGSDICCDGRITKSGRRLSATAYRVGVQVNGWRAYNVRSVRLDWRYKQRL